MEESLTNEESLTYKVIGCALKVHHRLGPGLLESIYEKAMLIELAKKNLKAKNQVPVDVIYDGVNLGEGLRIDILVEDELIVELKSVAHLTSIHFKQLQTYLKVTGKEVGLLINFNECDIMKGVKRVLKGQYIPND